MGVIATATDGLLHHGQYGYRPYPFLLWELKLSKGFSVAGFANIAADGLFLS